MHSDDKPSGDGPKEVQHFRTSPAKLDYEHVRQYQLHLVQSGWKPSYVKHTMSASRFLYRVTMGRRDALEMIPLARTEEGKHGLAAVHKTGGQGDGDGHL